MTAPSSRRRFVEPVMAAVARRCGLTVAQAYTVASGLVLSVLLAVTGLPPVLSAAGRVVPVVAPATRPDRPATDAADEEIAAPNEALGAASPGLLPFSSPPPLSSGPGSFADGGADDDDPSGEAPPVEPAEPLEGGLFASVPAPGAPAAVAVGPDGTVYVVTDAAGGTGDDGPSAIVAFDPRGKAVGSWAVPDQPAERELGLTAVAVDPDGRVWALDASRSLVLRLDPGEGTMATVARIPDLGPCVVVATESCEPGLVDSAPELRGLLVDPDGSVWVADRGQALIWSVDAGGEADAYAAISDRLPGEGPVGIARDREGALVVTVSARASSVPVGNPAVMRIPVTDAGAPGTPEVVLDLQAGDDPAGVVVGASDLLYVALSGVDAVVVVGQPTGPERLEAPGPGFASPSGLALRAGSLLVANRAPVSPPSRWVVLTLPIDDRPIVR